MPMLRQSRVGLNDREKLYTGFALRQVHRSTGTPLRCVRVVLLSLKPKTTTTRKMPIHHQSQFAERITTDRKSLIQPNPEDPLLSPDFLNYMDQLLVCPPLGMRSDLQRWRLRQSIPNALLFEFARDMRRLGPKLRKINTGKDALRSDPQVAGCSWSRGGDDFSGLEGNRTKKMVTCCSCAHGRSSSSRPAKIR